jgi:hypothetical protein
MDPFGKKIPIWQRVSGALIIFILIMTAFPAISQVGLVIKGTGFDKTWAIRKGRNLSVARFLSNYDSVLYSLKGRLVGITDSSLTLHCSNLHHDTTILFHNIAEVKVQQTGAGKFCSYTFLTAGVLTILYSPVAGFSQPESSLYQFDEFLTALGAGLVMTTIGALSVLPYAETYRVSGACRTSNGRFLYNGNGTYYFSFATGMGASYGGLGFRLQARFGRIMGVGAHVGVGWVFPYLPENDSVLILDNAVSVLTGIKFFPYRGLYLGVQFGNFGRIADVTRKDDQIILINARTPYGFIFSAGADWFLSRSFGFNFGAGIALDLTAPKSSNTFPTFDIGFIFKL